MARREGLQYYNPFSPLNTYLASALKNKYLRNKNRNADCLIQNRLMRDWNLNPLPSETSSTRPTARVTSCIFTYSSPWRIKLGLTFFPSSEMSSNHVLHSASCPEVGYFYHVGTPLPEGPCYLCFCQLSNHTAVCQETAKSLCDDRLMVGQDLASLGYELTSVSTIIYL